MRSKLFNQFFLFGTTVKEASVSLIVKSFQPSLIFVNNACDFSAIIRLVQKASRVQMTAASEK